MKRSFLAVAMLLIFCGQVFAGGLEVFLGNLNVQARADIGAFSIGLGAQFGVPAPQVQAIVSAVPEPADAFMVLQLAQWSHQPPAAVLEVYQANQGKGWGVIAKSLGIKPGSPEFHALKRGNLTYSGAPGGGPAKGGGKGKGKGKRH